MKICGINEDVRLSGYYIALHRKFSWDWIIEVSTQRGFAEYMYVLFRKMCSYSSCKQYLIIPIRCAIQKNFAHKILGCAYAYTVNTNNYYIMYILSMDYK